MRNVPKNYEAFIRRFFRDDRLTFVVVGDELKMLLPSGKVYSVPCDVELNSRDNMGKFLERETRKLAALMYDIPDLEVPPLATSANVK